MKITDEESIVSSPTNSFSLNSNLNKQSHKSKLLTIQKQSSFSSLVGSKRRAQAKGCFSEKADSVKCGSTSDPLEEMLDEALRDRTSYHNNKSVLGKSVSFNNGTAKDSKMKHKPSQFNRRSQKENQKSQVVKQK